jgi:hypothetical protein
MPTTKNQCRVRSRRFGVPIIPLPDAFPLSLLPTLVHLHPRSTRASLDEITTRGSRTTSIGDCCWRHASHKTDGNLVSACSFICQYATRCPLVSPPTAHVPIPARPLTACSLAHTLPMHSLAACSLCRHRHTRPCQCAACNPFVPPAVANVPHANVPVRNPFIRSAHPLPMCPMPMCPMPMSQFATLLFPPARCQCARSPAVRLPPMPTRLLAAVRLPASSQCTCSPPTRLAAIANVPLPLGPLVTPLFRSPAAKVPHANAPACNPSVPPPAANVPPFVCRRGHHCADSLTRRRLPLMPPPICRSPSSAARLPFNDAVWFATASSYTACLKPLTPGRSFRCLDTA